uniref:Uncharacterized protein n=1 Tax=Candidatus Kentrum sp. LPFa TaxID=2126335 RepID=A0A450X2N5_9GAMM|nr:MAG: hypothetical protein BECKLPF1236C_GA0070990_100069 [Candidatus Kentron sp. LPFa]
MLQVSAVSFRLHPAPLYYSLSRKILNKMIKKSENLKKWYFIDLFGFGFSGLGTHGNGYPTRLDRNRKGLCDSIHL